MIRYIPGNPELDYLVINWHARLIHTPEFEWTFCQSMISPVSFLSFFQHPKALVFELDQLGNIDQAIWFEPSMSGAYIGMWVSDGLRNSFSKGRAKFFFSVVSAAFDTVDVLVSTIKDRENVDKFLALHKRLGYVILGMIPHIFDGSDAFALYLSKENFYIANQKRLDRLGIKWGD